MYTLRKITESNVEMNITLGKSYTFVGLKDSPDEFNRTHKKFYEDQVREDVDVYAYVSDHDGKIYPLFQGQKAYIMSEKGRTFANVCAK